MRRDKKKFALMIASSVGLACATQASAAITSTWQPTLTGSYTWNTGGNWDNGVPGAAGDVANVNNNIAGAQTISLGSPISLGTLNLGDSDGSNTFTISSSTLTFQSATSGGATALNLGASGTVTNTVSSDVNVGGTSSLAILAAGGQLLATSGTFNTNANTVTLTGGVAAKQTWTINGDLTGSGTITVSTSGGVTVNGSKSFTGTFVLNSGTAGSSNTGSLVVTYGSIADAKEVIVNGYLTGSSGNNSNVQNGAILHVGTSVNTTTDNPGQRFTKNIITLNGGTFEDAGQPAFVGSANTWQQGLEYVSETLKTLNFNSGGSVLTSNAGGNTLGTQLAITTVKRGAGATAFIRSPTLGATSGQATTITATNGLDLLVGAGGASGTTTMSIIPWMTANGGNSSTNTPTTFATYVAGVGFRQLSTGTTESANSIGAGSTTNVRVSVLTMASNTTVNSLQFTASGASNITDSQASGTNRTLTVTSGGVFMSGTGTIGTAGATNAGVLNFGAAEGVIWSLATNTNTIGSAISGSRGITKGGTGTLVLAGANTYTGKTIVSGGTLRIGDGTNASHVGTRVNDDVEVANGAVLRLSCINGIGDQSTLTLDEFGLYHGLINIDAGLTETIGGFKIGSVFQTIGTYGGTGSSATNILPSYFTSGTGVLNVTATPEPSSLTLLGLGAMGLLRRRRR
ncbi:hypothetical protein BH10PLA1_BH10PLA1_04730 [soil metagenome]